MTANETASASPPTVSTTAESNVTSSSADLGGNVSANGGATVTDRGIVYSSSDTDPEIGDAGVTQDANGTGTGSFSETISGLSSNTTYYFKAYAINSEGTSYGSADQFTTLNTAPTVANPVSDFSVDEDAANSTFDLTDIFSDSEDSDSALTFSVESNSNSSLVNASVDNGTDELTLDYQADQSGSADITIRAQDTGGLTVDDAFTVTVNNLAPVFNSSTTASFAENGTGTVLDVNADNGGDGANDGGVTYSKGGTDGGAFNINASTGELTFASAPDFENPTDSDGQNDYVVEVTADDGASSNNTTTQTITVTVTDVNEAPTLSLGSTSGSLDENNTPNNVVTTITINDDAAGTNNLSLSGADAGAFQINGGNLEFNATADFETKSSYSVTVEVNDTAVGTDPDDSESFTLTINDVDETPSFTATGPFSVNDSAGVGGAVGDVDANVGGAADDGVSYSIVGGNDDVAGDGGGAFAIDAGSGAITVADADDIDSLQEASFTLTIEAAEGAQLQTVSVTINVIDDIAPAIAGTITPSVATITDAQVGTETFTLTVDFNEPMDTAVNPAVTFPTGGENPVPATLSNASGVWTDSDTFVVTWDVADDSAVIRDIDVRVAGAEDLAGNTMTAETQSDIFSVVTAEQIFSDRFEDSG